MTTTTKAKRKAKAASGKAPKVVRPKAGGIAESLAGVKVPAVWRKEPGYLEVFLGWTPLQISEWLSIAHAGRELADTDRMVELFRLTVGRVEGLLNEVRGVNDGDHCNNVRATPEKVLVALAHLIDAGDTIKAALTALSDRLTPDEQHRVRVAFAKGQRTT